jgi:hypothetical protein
MKEHKLHMQAKAHVTTAKPQQLQTQLTYHTQIWQTTCTYLPIKPKYFGNRGIGVTATGLKFRHTSHDSACSKHQRENETCTENGVNHDGTQNGTNTEQRIKIATPCIQSKFVCTSKTKKKHMFKLLPPHPIARLTQTHKALLENGVNRKSGSTTTTKQFSHFLSTNSPKCHPCSIWARTYS